LVHAARVAAVAVLQPKIVFADHLRGIAAIMVLVAHAVILYWTQPDLVAYYTFSVSSGVQPPTVVRWLSGFDFGSFGVGLFFLISGFVIPISLERLTPSRFLIARVLRIWPTYLAALATGLAIRYVSSCYWHTRFHVEISDIFANALLAQDFFGSASLDLVNWTLSLEVQFYILVALIYPALLIYRERVVVYAACILPIMLATQAMLPFVHFGLVAVRPAACLPFMLIGTLFYLQMKGIITRRSMISNGLFSVLAIVISLAKCINPAMSVSYAMAFGTFLALFLVRGHIGRNRVLAALSAISYPLYLVHSVTGYIVLQFMRLGLGASYITAVAAAIAASLVLATLLHFAIERPSMALGRRLSSIVGAGSPSLPLAPALSSGASR
jgi:peptidoglycan/LPS O-acetylase OafA/YrhL